MYFLWLPSVEVSISRVAKRVREGGHNIPEEVVRRRYVRGLANLFELYIPVLTTVSVYDGASFPPNLVAEFDGEEEHVLDYTHWECIRLQGKEAMND
ncbi:MAG: hypothetical protein ABL921_30290 [Pirellula sp.]